MRWTLYENQNSKVEEMREIQDGGMIIFLHLTFICNRAIIRVWQCCYKMTRSQLLDIILRYSVLRSSKAVSTWSCSLPINSFRYTCNRLTLLHAYTPFQRRTDKELNDPVGHSPFHPHTHCSHMGNQARGEGQGWGGSMRLFKGP